MQINQLGTFIIFTMLPSLALFALAVGVSTSKSLQGRFLAGGFPPEGGPTRVLYMSASVGYFLTSPSSLRPSFPSMDLCVSKNLVHPELSKPLVWIFT